MDEDKRVKRRRANKKVSFFSTLNCLDNDREQESIFALQRSSCVWQWHAKKSKKKLWSLKVWKRSSWHLLCGQASEKLLKNSCVMAQTWVAIREATGSREYFEKFINFSPLPTIFKSSTNKNIFHSLQLKST